MTSAYQNVSVIRNGSSDVFIYQPDVMVPWLYALSTSLAAMAVVLNTFTIVVIKKLRHTAYKPRLRLVLCLTLTDLMLSIEVIVFMIFNGNSVLHSAPKSTLHSLMNFVLKFAEVYGIILCLLNLLAIAVDQLISVVLPMKYIYIVTGTRMNRVVIGIWMSAFLIMVLPITVNCLTSPMTSCAESGRLYNSLINAAVCMLSLPIFLTIYAVIYKKIRLLQRSSSNTNRTFSMRKATVTSIILIIPFILIYFPVSVYVTIIWTLDVQITWPFWEVFMVLLALNTVTDPIIYAIRMPPIRRGYRTVFYCCRQPSTDQHSRSITSVSTSPKV